MDPNENLRRQRELRQRVVWLRTEMEARHELAEGGLITHELAEKQNEDAQGHVEDAHEEAASLASTLDLWLSGGRALPTDWVR